MKIILHVIILRKKKIAKIEQPYSVSLLNDSLWMVSGASKPQNKHKQWKGDLEQVDDILVAGIRITFDTAEKLYDDDDEEE